MTEVARDKIPGEKAAHVAVAIDDEDGATVYRADLHFSSRHDDPDATPDVASQLPSGPRE